MNFANHENDFLLENKRNLLDLQNFFIPGNLYKLTTSIPAYLTLENVKKRKWDWLCSYEQDTNKIVPVMFVKIYENDHDISTGLSVSIRAYSKIVCLQMLYGMRTVYVPMVPGSEKDLFGLY